MRRDQLRSLKRFCGCIKRGNTFHLIKITCEMWESFRSVDTTTYKVGRAGGDEIFEHTLLLFVQNRYMGLQK